MKLGGDDFQTEPHKPTALDPLTAACSYISTCNYLWVFPSISLCTYLLFLFCDLIQCFLQSCFFPQTQKIMIFSLWFIMNSENLYFLSFIFYNCIYLRHYPWDCISHWAWDCSLPRGVHIYTNMNTHTHTHTGELPLIRKKPQRHWIASLISLD